MSTTEHAGPDAWEHARRWGIGFLEDGLYAAAVSALQQAAAQDPGGDSEALLGLAHFQLEEYGLAADHYNAALQKGPDNKGWQDMLTRARANESSEINVQVPERNFFDRDELLAEALVPAGTLPPPPPPLRVTPLRKLRRLLGGLLGAVATSAMGIVTQLVGWIGGYRDDVWTNWYRRGLVLGILTLAYMREHLNKHSLNLAYQVQRVLYCKVLVLVDKI